MKIIVSIFFLLIAQPLIACSCIGEETPKQAKKSSDLVVIGKIIASKRVAFPFASEAFVGDSIDFMDYTLVVSKIYKGKAITDTLIIRTGFGHGDCGIEFILGEEYLIYGKDADEQNRKRRNHPYEDVKLVLHLVFETNICTRSTILKNADEDLKMLR
jgi:hypothetical protein